MTVLGYETSPSYSKILAPKCYSIVPAKCFPSLEHFLLLPKPSLPSYFHQVEKPFPEAGDGQVDCSQRAQGTVAIRWPQPQLWFPKEITHAAVGRTCHSLEPGLASEPWGPTAMRTAATSNRWALEQGPVGSGGCCSSCNISPTVIYSHHRILEGQGNQPQTRHFCLCKDSHSSVLSKSKY